MTTLQTFTANSGAATQINEIVRTLSPAGLYGINPATTTGLTLGYYGGILDGVSYPDGTHVLTASTTRYVVAARATGVVSSSTGTTNWSNQSSYLRMGIAVVGASTITSWTDWREAYAGASSSGSGVAGADKQVQFNDGGAFGAQASFEYDKTTTTLTVAKINEAKSIDLASAATTDIGSATSGNFVHITGSATITSFGTVAAGARRQLVFDSAALLTHNPISLILPTGANITTATGDTAVCISEGAGNWIVASYQRKDGTALAGSASRVPSIQTVVSASTVTPTFSDDMVKITAQAAGLTLANPTGTAIDGLGLVIRIKDNGTARSIAYGTQYRSIGVTLPTTTVIGKTVYLAMIYNNNDTKWDVLAVGQEA